MSECYLRVFPLSMVDWEGGNIWLQTEFFDYERYSVLIICQSYEICGIFYGLLRISHCHSHSCVLYHGFVVKTITESYELFSVHTNLVEKYGETFSFVDMWGSDFHEEWLGTTDVEFATNFILHHCFKCFEPFGIAHYEAFVDGVGYSIEK